MSYRRYSDGDGWVLLIVLVLVLAGFVAYWIARLCWAMLTEAVRVYQDHGFSHSKVGKLLRWSLVGFVVVVLISSLGAVLFPTTTGVDAALISWSFFLWSGIVALCSWFAGKRDRGHHLGDLDTYLDGLSKVDTRPTRSNNTNGNSSPASIG